MNKTLTIESKNHKYANTYGAAFTFQILIQAMRVAII